MTSQTIEETTMLTAPATLTEAQFREDAWTAPNGLTVHAIESDAGDFIGAYGDVDGNELAAAANAYDAWTANRAPVERWTSQDVCVLWVVATRPAPDFHLEWDGITPETPGAFPLTIVSDQ